MEIFLRKTLALMPSFKFIKSQRVFSRKKLATCHINICPLRHSFVGLIVKRNLNVKATLCCRISKTVKRTSQMNHSGRHKVVHVRLLFGVYKAPVPIDVLAVYNGYRRVGPILFYLKTPKESVSEISGQWIVGKEYILLKILIVVTNI